MMRRLLAVGTVVLGLLGVTAGAAAADPVNAKNAIRTTLRCDNGQAYDVVVNGNGEFTPAHDLDSNAVLKPFAFGELTITVTDPGDNTRTFTEPATAKRNAGKKDLVGCTFTFGSTEDGLTFTVSGTVLVKITGGR